MKILSLRVEDHDSSACLYDNGNVKYFQAERRYGVKHFGYFPRENDLMRDFLECEKKERPELDHIFDAFGVTADEIDVIVEVPDDPSHNNFLFTEHTPFVYQTLDKKWNLDIPVFYVEHHWAHANSVWPISKDVEYSVVYDGLGSGATHASIFHKEKRIAHLGRKSCESVCIEMHSIAHKCGINCHCALDLPGKLMGMQSFGDRQKATKIFEKLYANYTLESCPDIAKLMTHLQEDNSKDIAMAFQMWVESATVDWFKKYIPTDATVSFSGGLSQNVLLNHKLSMEYKNLVIPPHSNDAGLSIGALGSVKNILELKDFQLENFPFCQSDESPTETPTKETIATIAKELANGKIVAMYQGNGEVGPRALGNRSILMDPTVKNGKDIINERVKKRENYRPFGAAVMLEHVSDWFDWEGETPYMLHAVPVRDKSIESVTHVDGTCRIQTVKDGMMYDLLDEFYKITNVPVLLNTSLNLAGKPIAGTISEARQLFDDVDIDILCYGDTILYK